MNRIFDSAICTILSSTLEKNRLQLSLQCTKKKIMIYMDLKKRIHMSIGPQQYLFNHPGMYSVLYHTKNRSVSIVNIEIWRINEGKWTEEELEQVISSMKIYEFGNPIVLSKKKYQIMYSFDQDYYVGAMASINSLLINFNQNKKNDLVLHLCIGQEDLPSFLQVMNNLESLFSVETIVYVLNQSIVDESIMKTTCYKGGNHLLKISNFNRLICGHVIECPHLLYLDSDTIIQTDLSALLDKIPNTPYVIMGKQSQLTLKNLLNCNNIEHAKRYIGEHVNKSIIYTGTLLIQPALFRQHYPEMINLVRLHNELEKKGGLYKLFTMSIINITLIKHILYFDPFLNNVVDLGCKNDLQEELIKKADVLDWSGIHKPWYSTGFYREQWKKYDLFDANKNCKQKDKNTVESFS